jgi:hypothetical protein
MPFDCVTPYPGWEPEKPEPAAPALVMLPLRHAAWQAHPVWWAALCWLTATQIIIAALLTAAELDMF